MAREMLLGPTCQSCGMPMKKPDEFGTSETGAKITSYCRFCYEKGKFVEPGITMEEMIERAAALMSDKKGVVDDAARNMARGVISRLKRWAR